MFQFLPHPNSRSRQSLLFPGYLAHLQDLKHRRYQSVLLLLQGAPLVLRGLCLPIHAMDPCLGVLSAWKVVMLLPRRLRGV